ncbi:hypothetical protein C9F11_24265 [Streptomyces sp. YIM 121038]|uniref:hypothetical protein n=1 Tax=Streptomyces sp. YIM 121038 TaxID=2136401 RepID=UPI0011104E15|nr:hypothetical protein [Streptomyces sp. YIM 121038]QCX78469.1 hypothetical protein C9F11_24265 [Streptomyces sp. YIM 121038]
MSLPQHRKLALATATALALLTAGLAWQAAAADGGGHPASPGAGAKSGTVSSERVEHGPGAAGDYWTPERMRAAEPAPMPVVPGE